MATYPGGVFAPATKTPGQAIQSAHMNAVQDEIVALQQEIVTSGLTNILRVNANIKFPATQASSADANTLDDYEEGTWTPVIAGAGGTSGQSYSLQQGRYTKIGRLMTVEFTVILTAKGTITGDALITGLPISPDVNARSVGAINYTDLATNWVNVHVLVANGQSYLYLRGCTTSTTTNNTSLVGSDFSNITTLVGSIQYWTA